MDVPRVEKIEVCLPTAVGVASVEIRF